MAIEGDALKPEMQSHQVGKAHAAMHFRCRSRDLAANFGKVCLGMAGSELCLIGQGILGVGCIPDERPARLKCGRPSQHTYA